MTFCPFKNRRSHFILHISFFQSYGSDEEVLYRSRSDSTLYSSENDLVAASKHHAHNQSRHIHIKQPHPSSTMRAKKYKAGAPPYFMYAPPGFNSAKYPSALNAFKSNYYMGTVNSTGSIKDVWGRQRPVDQRPLDARYAFFSLHNRYNPK